ncbi:proline-rich protein 2-like [Tyto alba]|uniref:proline-rich protein 2-like n=1 Tax=Tyto alba TaxID=56313 RepID=UPI001C685693|nr:proline-rich protein 2-like [Tyto alba]
MAPVLAEGSVALATAVAWGSATTGLLLLLLLLFCSFSHRASRRFSTQKIKEKSGLVRGVKLVRLGSGGGGAARPGGTPSPGEPQQQEDSPTVPGDPDNPAAGDPELHMLGWTPRSHVLSSPTPRAPEFLRHRQLPVVPGGAGTPAADTVPDAEGPIYESIRYKSGTLAKPWGGGSTPGDSPPQPAGDELSIPVQIIAQEEPGSEGNPDPVYARVCKPPRAPQPRQPTGPAEPQEEASPSVPEKRFDVA